MNIKSIPIGLIEEDQGQPRYTFDEEALGDLANSISEVGLLSPIKVRQLDNGRFKIIFGNRRYKACKLLGLESINCIVSEAVDELEIYLEQLAENIQRENFSPVEEAEAFEKMINNPSFKISTKFLSSKLGKKETYIKKKLELLNFGKAVRNLIVNGSDIKQDKLTEEQVLPLKDVPIEYRDSLAMIVARDQVGVQDTKRIATIFKDDSLNNNTKSELIMQNGNTLLSAWSVYEEEKKSNKSPKEKPKPITEEYIPDNTLLDTFTITPIEERLQDLMAKLPTHRPIPSNVIYSYEQIRLSEKEDFLRGLDVLIGNLEKHLIEWKKIRDISKAPTIKLIKK